MLNIVNLNKKYATNIAVSNLNLFVDKGEIAVLVGENGAGKTTTINSIADLISYEGIIEINGFKNSSLEAKEILGVVPEMAHPYENLTVMEHMEYISKVYRVTNWKEKSEKLLFRFNMLAEKNKLGKELSKGMRQKLNICMTLVHSPSVIIFDEPIIGLDPIAINEIKKVIIEQKALGNSILISTHILDTVADLWDKAFIMSKGVLIKEIYKNEISSDYSLEKLYVDMLNSGDK